MSDLFNSVFETSLRVLLLMPIINEPASFDKIALLDFMTTYSKVFNLTDENLNGNSDFVFSEYTLRRELVKSAIKKLVLEGLLTPSIEEECLMLASSSQGRTAQTKMVDSYSKKYQAAAKTVLAFTKNMNEQQIASLITEKAVSSVKGKEL
ncbi:MAG: ABC-three component system middle component 2 [Sphaerochaetaceae bacterium]